MCRRIVSLVVLLCSVLALPACATPLTYSAKEIHGQIVDAETGEPIEGAVIVAQWILFEIGVGHRKRLHIEETVTDKGGHYVIPAWGPKPHPPFTELDREDPMLAIFKTGYAPLRLYNRIDRSDSVRVSDWGGKVVRLKRTEGTLEEQAFRLSSFYGGLIGDHRDPNEWRQYPRMLIAVHAEKQRLRSLGLAPEHAARVPDIERFTEDDKKFLRRFAQ